MVTAESSRALTVPTPRPRWNLYDLCYPLTQSLCYVLTTGGGVHNILVLWIEPPLFKTPPALFGKYFEKNRTPDSLFENENLKKIEPRAPFWEILKKIEPRAKRGENFGVFWPLFLVLQCRIEEKQITNFAKIEPRHNISEKNRTPREARRNFWKK